MGIAVLLSFFNSQVDLRDSDEKHVNFAKCHLEKLRFLYKHSDHDESKACSSNQISNVFLIYLLEMEGALLQPPRRPYVFRPSCGY